jgi:hypothetical protein
MLIIYHVIVGDEAFPLRRNLLRPYARAQTGGSEQKLYSIINSAELADYLKIVLAYSHINSESSNRGFSKIQKNIIKIILASCVLHNLLRGDTISFTDKMFITLAILLLIYLRKHFYGSNEQKG